MRHSVIPSTTSSRRPIKVHGKFFNCAGQKFFFKAMRLAGVGSALDFDQKLELCRQLDQLNQSHTTGLILTEAQAHPIIDIAGQIGMHAIVELAVAPDELIERRHFSAAVSRIAHIVNILKSSSALLGYLIDCPISQDEIRAHGLSAIRRRLRALIATIRDRDDRALVAIKHRPETRALAMVEEDLVYGEVPALAPVELRDFVVSLHNLAEARPVVIEFHDTSPGQDEAVAVAFGCGAAGVVAPPVPAPASSDFLGVRMLKAAELMPFVTLNGTCPPKPARIPMVSVVICAYNAERTMRPCLESLRKLDYPNYEVVIIDDGSRDRTAEISMDFPEFRLIRQPNKGLSVARNVGLHAARGEIIAYTDSDCVVDPHWLTLMVRAMVDDNLDGCGGPNYAPHEDGRVEACVAASPGAPCHVLVGHDRAEHLAGCNMVFTKAALEAVGGFDPQFTSAGDDVDVCWRILAAGMRLGFCPAAFVWHFRRNTITAYFGQQRGYGRAEAMLYARYPERFNVLGQIKWQGTIPGLARTIPGGAEPRVLWAAARPGLHSVFDPALSLAAFLPQTLEWAIGWEVGAIACYLAGLSVIPALAMQLLGVVWALFYAWNAPVEKCHDSLSSRLLVAYLAYTGPIARTWARYKHRLAALARKTENPTVRQRPQVNWLRRAIRLTYWNEHYITREKILDHALKYFARLGHPAILDRGWNDYDVELRPDPWTRIELRTADEEHGQAKVRSLVEARVRVGRGVSAGLLAGFGTAAAAALLGFPQGALALGALSAAAALSAASKLIESGRIVYGAIESAAADLNLIPLGAPTRAVRAERMLAASAPAANPAAPAAAERASEPAGVESLAQQFVD
jgi:glycosyltransferase involved in cell wall biosynthesis